MATRQVQQAHRLRQLAHRGGRRRPQLRAGLQRRRLREAAEAGGNGLAGPGWSIGF